MDQRDSTGVSLLRPQHSQTARSSQSSFCGVLKGSCSKLMVALLLATGALLLWIGLSGRHFGKSSSRKLPRVSEMEGSSEVARLTAHAVEYARYLPKTPTSKSRLASSAEAAFVRNDEGRMDSLRGFVVVYFEDLGFLLLRSTERKGKRLQLPGGHGDWQDFRVAFERREKERQQGDSSGAVPSEGVLLLGGQVLDLKRLSEIVMKCMRERAEEQQRSEEDLEDLMEKQFTLMEWGRVAAARELWEEVGIDLVGHFERLIALPPVYRKSCSTFIFLLVVPVAEQKELFSGVSGKLLDKRASTSKFSFTAVKAEGGEHATSKSHAAVLRMDLNEHSGFLFETSLRAAAEHVQGHANGMASQALKQLEAIMENKS